MSACKEIYEMLVELMILAYVMILSVTGYLDVETAIPLILAIAGITISTVHTINGKKID